MPGSITESAERNLAEAAEMSPVIPPVPVQDSPLEPATDPLDASPAHSLTAWGKHAVRQSVKWCLAQALPHDRLIVSGGRTAGIFLTFDDGPHPQHTPELLDALARYEIPATFFVLGKHAQAYPEIVERIAAEGHTLGNHTWTHSDPNQLSRAEFAAELQRTDELIERITGTPPQLMRPPKGKLTLGKMQECWRRGLSIALWSCDPRDYSVESADQLWRRIEPGRPRQGDVVLLHDIHPFATRILPRLVDRVAQADGQFQDLATLLNIEPGRAASRQMEQHGQTRSQA